MNNKGVPDFRKSLDIKAFAQEELGACGCVELDELLITIRDFLTWVDTRSDSRLRYDILYKSPGIFYCLASMIERAGLIDHGTSIRYPFITELGKELLQGINNTAFESIDKAEGESYSGLYYIG